MSNDAANNVDIIFECVKSNIINVTMPKAQIYGNANPKKTPLPSMLGCIHAWK